MNEKVNASKPAFAVALVVADARAAMRFYAEVFGAAPVPPCLTAPDGGVAHAEMSLLGGRIMLADAAFGGRTPTDLGGVASRISLTVGDVDAVVAKAVAAGADVIIEVSDQFYGHRSGRIRDPFGHEWILGQVLENLSEAEMQARMEKLFAAG